MHTARDPLYVQPAIIAVELPLRREAPLPGTAKQGSWASRRIDENVLADRYNAATTEGGDRSNNPRAAERAVAIG